MEFSAHRKFPLKKNEREKRCPQISDVGQKILKEISEEGENYMIDR